MKDVEPSPVAMSSSQMPGSVWLNLNLMFKPENSVDKFWIRKTSKVDELHRQVLENFLREDLSEELLTDALHENSRLKLDRVGDFLTITSPEL